MEEYLKRLEEEAKKTGKRIQFSGNGEVRLVDKKKPEKKGLWGSDLMKAGKIRDDLQEIE